jgi:hypothetical protein
VTGWDLPLWAELTIGVLSSIVISSLFFFLTERANERRYAQLLSALAAAAKQPASGEGEFEPREGNAGPRRPKRSKKSRPAGSGDWVERYRGVSIEYSDQPGPIARLGRSIWLRRARVALGAVFLLVLSPWLVSFWLLRWNLNDQVLISFDWYEFPPIRPLINALSDFETWGFWLLVSLLLCEALLSWSRQKWKVWAFLHPAEVRFYPDGSYEALSAELVVPSRVAVFVVRHSGALTICVAILAAAWYLIAPYTQLPANLVVYDPTVLAAFYPLYLLFVMSIWMSVLWILASFLRLQLDTLDKHRQIVTRLQMRFGSGT